MIRINLLPVKRKRKIKGITSFLITTGSITAGVVAILISINIYLKSDLKRLKSQIESNKTKMQTLTKKIEEAKKYEKLNKEIEARSNIIDGLRKNQLLPAKILDNLSIALPEGIWLVSLIYKDGAVELEGHAFTNFEIVSYVESLKKIDNFTDVTLIESRETEVEKTRLYKFKINLKVKV